MCCQQLVRCLCSLYEFLKNFSPLKNLSGGRGEPKAAEFSESDGSNLQPYHRTSAAWSEKEAARTSGGGRLEVKSGDFGDFRRGGNSRIGELPFYIRSAQRATLPHHPHRHVARHFSSTASGAGSSSSYHRQAGRQQQETDPSLLVRSSRVPSTSDYVSSRTYQPRASYQYPPLQKIGQGDGEVYSEPNLLAYDIAAA
jgi:hypothetical protein